MTATDTRFHPAGVDLLTFTPRHFLWQVDGSVATITLNRPDRKNPLTFESYAELRDTFRNLAYTPRVKTVVVAGAGGNFCSEATSTKSSVRWSRCSARTTCRGCWRFAA